MPVAVNVSVQTPSTATKLPLYVGVPFVSLARIVSIGISTNALGLAPTAFRLPPALAVDTVNGRFPKFEERSAKAGVDSPLTLIVMDAVVVTAAPVTVISCPFTVTTAEAAPVPVKVTLLTNGNPNSSGTNTVTSLIVLSANIPVRFKETFWPVASRAKIGDSA